MVLGDDFRIRRIQRFLVRQWIHIYTSLRSLRLLSPYPAQCLVLSGTCYASVTEFACRSRCTSCCVPSCRRQTPDACHHGRYGPEGAVRGAVQKTKAFPQLQFIVGRRFSCRGAEADSHGPCDHGVSPVARGYGGRCPCCAGRVPARCWTRHMPMVQTLQTFVEVPQSQFLHGYGRPCDCAATPREEGNQSSCREFTTPRDEEGTRVKGWVQSNVRFGPVLDIKVCNHNGRYSIEVQVKSLFQDQTVSWIRIVNGIDKFVREAMPIHEEENASGKPAAKARPILKPSSTSDVNFTPVGQRKWMDIETQESNDPVAFKCRNSSLDYHHTVIKIIEKMMEQSIMTKLLLNARKSNSTILNIGHLRGSRNSSMLRIGRLNNGYQLWQEVEDKKTRFQYC